jgi:hypothetical protein
MGTQGIEADESGRFDFTVGSPGTYTITLQLLTPEGRVNSWRVNEVDFEQTLVVADEESPQVFMLDITPATLDEAR